MTQAEIEKVLAGHLYCNECSLFPMGNHTYCSQGCKNYWGKRQKASLERRKMKKDGTWKH